ncbi:hypothetical protein AB4072_07325 [Microvirga sp. 2MCAF38]|uniref:hypothetical protein n=1 Tax=Microvirga sp. 2MCAF38 TaxID=3232989 RepID=UPI003F9E1BBB
MNNARPIDLPDLNQADTGTIMDYFRSHLQQVVTLHMAMFEKLLFEADDLPVELAEFFEDAGNTYLNISETISKRYRRQRMREIDLQVKE